MFNLSNNIRLESAKKKILISTDLKNSSFHLLIKGTKEAEVLFHDMVTDMNSLTKEIDSLANSEHLNVKKPDVIMILPDEYCVHSHITYPKTVREDAIEGFLKKKFKNANDLTFFTRYINSDTQNNIMFIEAQPKNVIKGLKGKVLGARGQFDSICYSQAVVYAFLERNPSMTNKSFVLADIKEDSSTFYIVVNKVVLSVYKFKLGENYLVNDDEIEGKYLFNVLDYSIYSTPNEEYEPIYLLDRDARDCFISMLISFVDSANISALYGKIDCICLSCIPSLRARFEDENDFSAYKYEINLLDYYSQNGNDTLNNYPEFLGSVLIPKFTGKEKS